MSKTNTPNTSSYRRQRKNSRFGWTSIIFALVANLLIFLSINWVNRAPAATPPQEYTIVELFHPQIDPPEAIAEPLKSTQIPKITPTNKPEPLRPAITPPDFKPRLIEWTPQSLLTDSQIPLDLKTNDTPPVPSGPIANASADSPAQRISGLPPRYPRWANATAAEGTVTLRFIITAQGKAANIEVQSITGDKRFATSAKRAIQSWRFKPAVHNNSKVPAWAIQTIEFRRPE